MKMGAHRRLKPIHADDIACIRERTKAKVSSHTDGGVFDLVNAVKKFGRFHR
jgi:uncharacterized membrane protein YecN with MAPEG domain